MNRPGFLQGRKCEGNALEPDDFRLRELQLLARALGISYTGIKKDDLCAILREYYLRFEMEEANVNKIPERILSDKSRPKSRLPIIAPRQHLLIPPKPQLSPELIVPTPPASSAPPPPPPPPKPKSVIPSKVVPPIISKVSPPKTLPKALPSPTKISPVATKVSPKKPSKKEEVSNFYSDTNPNGFIRKIEYRSIKPEVPLLIFNLERKTIDERMRVKVNTASISPTQYIGIGDSAFVHMASVVFHGGPSGGHYITVFECDEKWYLYDDIQSAVHLIANSHEQLLELRPDILTNGVLHFYTNSQYRVESPFKPCTRLGPQYYQNSCYMDSTILALFAISNSYLFENLFEKPLKSDVDESKKLSCSVTTKEKIREQLIKILNYLAGEDVTDRKFCVDLRTLFKQCHYPTYEQFGTTAQQSASEFLSYLFRIFGIEMIGMIRYTYGTMDLDASSESALNPKDPDNAVFNQTSVTDTKFNFMFEVGPFKLDEYDGRTTNDLLDSIDDTILL